MKRILTEFFNYKYLNKKIDPTINLDEYAANMGDDDEIVTLAFTVKGQQASEDLVDWFERGYDYVLDSEVSDGQVTKGKYLVFVEMNRRTTVPERIVELIEDLETLTNLPVEDWTIIIDKEEYTADVEQLKQVIILSPSKYRQVHEEDLNEMRERAGLEPQKIFKEQDSLLKDFISKAGL
jgi:hypothetical protein